MSEQRAIFYVQKELELILQNEKQWFLGLCDRGTIDGLAYWPAEEALFWKDLGTTKNDEFKKYSCVIHLRTPTRELGYNLQNPFRIETAIEASQIDEKIKQVWKEHPAYCEVESSPDFFMKAKKALDIIRDRFHSCPICERKFK